MLKKTSIRLMLVLAAAAAGVAFAADPTLAQVYEAARSGHLDQAQQMMVQVLHDHPRSAKAHYVAAEVDARAGNVALARQELKTAEELEPGLPFANPESVHALQRELSQARGGDAGAPVAYASHGRASSPWGLVLVLVGAGAVLWMIFNRRRAQPPVYPQYPGAAPGVGPGAPGGMPGPVMTPGYGGTGPGIMGSLASGLAVGAGVAAGEELVRHVLEPGQHTGGFIPSAGAAEPDFPQNGDMGGNDFGVSDPGSWDDGLTGGDVGGGDDWT